MVNPADFKSVIRDGSRAGNSVVVVHCRTDEEREKPLVGFVVAKRDIPRATDRNRVRRQMRHLMSARLHTFPPGGAAVVRISGNAVGRDFDELGHHLDNALGRAWRKWDGKAATS